MDVEAANAVVTHFPPWIGPSIQAGAIVIAAIGVGLMILTNRTIARRRSILDLIILVQTDGDVLRARGEFATLKKTGNLAQYATPDKMDSHEAAVIRLILNMYEVVAIGINEGAYDKKIYKDWCRTTAVKDWIAAKGLIAEYQQVHNPKLYEHFEILVKEWANGDEKKHI